MPTRSRSMPFPRTLAAALVLATAVGVHLPWTALAAEMAEVVQKGRAFAVREVTIARGSVLRFLNEDEFPHQIYIDGPGFTFDSDLQSPGEPIDVAFPEAGSFAVRCGVHPKMRMSVRVK